MRNNRNKGITLIALVITIIVLVILAAIAISTLTKENGIFSKVKDAKVKNEEAEAKEKLELILNDIIIDKKTGKNNYEEKLETEGIMILDSYEENGIKYDEVIVEGWQFKLDRAVPKIVEALGKGNINGGIEIVLSQEMKEENTIAAIKIVVSYKGEIEKITCNGKKLELPGKNAQGKYELQEEVRKNATYKIMARDKEGGYKTAEIAVTKLVEDLEIRTVADMKKFRDEVNAGTTFKNRNVRLMNDINLNEGKYTKDSDGFIRFNEAAESWEPIKKFSGKFFGNGNTIYGLYCKNEGTNSILDGQGLFARLTGGEIHDLSLKDGLIYAGSYSGSFAGWAEEGSKLNRCSSNIKIQYKNDTKERHGCAIGGIVRNGKCIYCARV